MTLNQTRQLAAASILDETAGLRHAARTEAAWSAALAVANGKPEVAVFVLLADTLGVGGRQDCEGGATKRVPGLDRLGSGRKQARDGGAWDAAIEGALKRLIHATGCDPVGHGPLTVPMPEAGAGALTSIMTGGELPAWRAADECLELALPGYRTWVYAGDCAECPIPARWLRTVAREGLRRALGLDPWFPDHQVLCRWEGSAAEWAGITNRLEARLERERQEAAWVERCSVLTSRAHRARYQWARCEHQGGGLVDWNIVGLGASDDLRIEDAEAILDRLDAIEEAAFVGLTLAAIMHELTTDAEGLPLTVNGVLFAAAA